MDNFEFDTGTEQYFNLQYNNGVFDLRLKKLRPRLKSDYVTKILDYDYMEADQISPEVHEDVKRFYEQTQPAPGTTGLPVGVLGVMHHWRHDKTDRKDEHRILGQQWKVYRAQNSRQGVPDLHH